MENNLLFILALLFALSTLALLSDKLRISYPIFLVIAGMIISLIPNLPKISLNLEEGRLRKGQ
ncbi:MAG: hypothetical protein C5B59_16420 [Bacteroidetes bacterium]|nr:MAG: hypothetical protein C5B59_16420 [Bacteroidota bacterium]